MGKNEEIQNTKIETFKVQLTSKNQELESSKQCVALNQERIAALEQSLGEQMTKASQEVLQIQNVATTTVQTAVQNATEKVKLEEKKKYEKLENEMKEIKLSNTKFIQTIQTIQSVQEEQKEQEKMASELQSQLQSQLQSVQSELEQLKSVKDTLESNHVMKENQVIHLNKEKKELLSTILLQEKKETD